MEDHKTSVCDSSVTPAGNYLYCTTFGTIHTKNVGHPVDVNIER